MKIGLVNFFPLRPHYYNHIFFGKILERDGHEVQIFSCSGGNLDCYYKNQHKKIPGFIVCLNCRIRRLVGELDKKEKIYNYAHNSKDKIAISSDAIASAQNSYATINRIESFATEKSFDKDKIDSISTAISNITVEFKHWLTRNKIDGVVIFNARMDLFSGCKNALKELKIPYCAYEASMFGNGCYLYPNSSCLSMDIFKEANRRFTNSPLTNQQAIAASEILLARINRTSKLEWRSYYHNDKTENLSSFKSKLLILPSSTNENYGDNNDLTSWTDFLKGMEKIISVLGVDSSEIIVRGHPVWAQGINGIYGFHIDEYYKRWCWERGYKYITAQSKIDSKHLIRDTEIVLLYLGSSFIEAAFYGKKVISTHHSYFSESDLVITVTSDEELNSLHHRLNEQDKITPEQRMAKLLRVIYTLSHRLCVYNNEIINTDLLNTKYKIEAESNKLISAIFDNQYPYSDLSHAYDETEENQIVKKVMSGDTETLPMVDNYIEGRYYTVDEMTNSKLGKVIYRLETCLRKGDYNKF